MIWKLPSNLPSKRCANTSHDCLVTKNSNSKSNPSKNCVNSTAFSRSNRRSRRPCSNSKAPSFGNKWNRCSKNTRQRSTTAANLRHSLNSCKRKWGVWTKWKSTSGCRPNSMGNLKICWNRPWRWWPCWKFSMGKSKWRTPGSGISWISTDP